MDKQELAKKAPMAPPGFTVMTPKTETEYDKKIQAEQEKQMADCCGNGYSRYDYYGYKPRPKDSVSEPQDAPQSDKKTANGNKK